MNNYFKIHTQAISATAPNSRYQQGEIGATPLKGLFGWISSLGKTTERLSMIAKDPSYSIAIQVLSPQEQEDIKRRGHAGWWKQFFWKPLTLSVDGKKVMILVNISSVMKRSGLSKLEVNKHIEKNTLIEGIQENYLKKQNNNPSAYSDVSGIDGFNHVDLNAAKDIYQLIIVNGFVFEKAQNIHMLISQHGYSLEEASKICEIAKKKGFSLEKARKIYDYHSEYKYAVDYDKSIDHAQMVYDYVNQLHCPIDRANQIVAQLLLKKLKMPEIQQIAVFIGQRQQIWQRGVARTQKPIYIQAKQFPGQIPRNIEYHTDGTIYILFNRLKRRVGGEEGDPCIGRGGYKVVKSALNLMNGEIEARLTMDTSTPEGKKIALKEFRIGQKVVNSNGVLGINMSRVINYTSKSGRLKMSVTQKLFNGGAGSKLNISSLSRQERFLIAERVITGVCSLHQIDIVHRDMKLDNILLIKDPKTNKIIDCVVADLGLAVEKADEETRKEELSGSILYMAPEYLSAFISSPSEAEKMKLNDTPIDAWGLGLILYELFKHEVAEWTSLPSKPFWFQASNIPMLQNKLEQFTQNGFPQPTDPESIGHVIIGLLHPNPEKRMSAAEALSKLNALKSRLGG